MKTFLKLEKRRKSSESWQIVYMDLMTNIMIFFVILWTINSGKKIEITSLGDTTRRMVSLPGDVIFSTGKTKLTDDGKDAFRKLFTDESGDALRFDSNALMKRLLVIHGHTDGDGNKMENFMLGFGRALSSYQEISKYNRELPEHVVLCTHADNTPAQEVPKVSGKLTKEQKDVLATAKAKNRRITIEDQLVSLIQDE